MKLRTFEHAANWSPLLFGNFFSFVSPAEALDPRPKELRARCCAEFTFGNLFGLLVVGPLPGPGTANRLS